MIKFTQDETQPNFYGYLYAVLLFVIEMLSSLLSNQFVILSKVVGMRIRAAIITAVYKKVCHNVYYYHRVGTIRGRKLSQNAK
jgi:hypothetical protein